MNQEPAFPQNELSQYDGSVCAQHSGLTMRDYFAAAVLPSQLRYSNVGHAAAVKLAYELADLMLQERLK